MISADFHALATAAAGFFAKMTVWEALGYVGAAAAITGSAMKTMIPLRCIGIATNFIFLVYGVALGIIPTIIVNTILLPLNISRLVEMLRLVRKVRRAANCDLSMDWLKPFMSRRKVSAGEVLFRKGDAAECLFYILRGRYRLRELNLDVLPGQLIGELGFLAPDNARTQTLEALEDGEVLTITYDQVRQLYFQNPEFGFYFLRLTSNRLFENVARLEAEVAALRAAKPREPLHRVA